MKSISVIKLALTVVMVGCASVPHNSPIKILDSVAKDRLRVHQIDDVSPSDGRKHISDRSYIINQLLEPKIDPYSGTESRPESCLIPALPKVISGESYRIHSFFSSQDMVLGKCTGRRSDLKTQYLSLYCPSQKKVFFISYFYKGDQDWKIDPIAECEN